jgi:hemerythrin
VILLSDLMLQHGRFANMAEFPVLQMLYRQGMILPNHPNNTGRKPIIVGSRQQVEAQLKYIYRGNYGLASEEELRAAGLSEEDAKRHMAIKNAFAFGRIRPSEELLDFRIVEDKPVEISDGVMIRRLSLNHFELSYQGRKTEVDLNLGPGESYEAPYTLGQHRIEPQYFGVVHSGEGDGWDVRRQSMGSIVMYQGRYYLMDAGPNIMETLKSLGHRRRGDRRHLPDARARRPLRGLRRSSRADGASSTTRRPLVPPLGHAQALGAALGRRGALRRALRRARPHARPLERLRRHGGDAHGLAPPGRERDLPHARARRRAYKTYAHWADIVSLDVLRRMVSKGPAKEILGPEYVDKVRAIYLKPATVKKIDAGGGMIHGEALDFAEDASEKIILAHRATRFSPDQLEVGSSAIFGAVDVLIPSSQDYLRQRAYGHLAPVFPDATPAELNSLLRSPIEEFNAGSLILRRGKMASHVYLLLSGTVEQIVPGLEAPLNVVSGALLGGQALSGTGMLTDSWRAASPVRAMKIGSGRCAHSCTTPAASSAGSSAGRKSPSCA